MSVDPVGADIPEALQDAVAAQLQEYGQFVATQRIHVGLAMAYDVGHPVPVSNVERFGYEAQGVVTRVASPENARRGITDEQAEAGLTEPVKLTEENDDPLAAPPAPTATKSRGGNAAKGS